MGLTRTLVVASTLLTLTPGGVLAEQIIRVPADAATLQAAMTLVSDGGTIEMASGTYASPAGGFSFGDLGKGFTIRPESGGTVTLDGGGARPILLFQNSSLATGRPVVFESLAFKNGLSTANGVGGAVTLRRAEATFSDCTFEDNSSQAPTSGGGAMNAGLGSIIFFLRSNFVNNTADNTGGGLQVSSDSTVYVHESQFVGNRTNLPGHNPSSGGGGIHMSNSTLRVTNSRFEGNQAGWVGGGIYALGSWTDPVTVPQAEVYVANSTFIDNQVTPATGVTPPSVAVGGAFHAENQTTARFYNSRFITNSAAAGGAVNLYRSIVEVHDSVFLGNRATGVGLATGFGGSINANSNDDASEDRRTAQLTVTDSLIQGRYQAVGTVGQTAGCLFVVGDQNRAFGLGGAPQTGTVADNRAVAVVDNVVFADCDVLDTPEGGASAGTGGAIGVATTDLTLTNSLVIDSDGDGDFSDSGAMRITYGSYAKIYNSTFAHNTAGFYGGALLVQGSEIDIDGCQFFENEISPGVSEAENSSRGAAIFTLSHLDFPQAGSYIRVTGTVANSTFSNNVGLPIFDQDETTEPINAVVYNNNSFYNTTFGDKVYRDNVAGSAWNAAGLNALVVSRGMGVPTTDKSPLGGNTNLGSAPLLGALLGVPPAIVNAVASGDAGSATESYLAWARSGAAATLDGSPVAGTGWQSDGVGVHTLAVGAQDFMATISQGPTPSLSFTADPTAISGGESSQISWSTLAGTFYEMAIDQGVGWATAAMGSAMVTPPATTTYTGFLTCEEGGASVPADVLVDEDVIFSDGFESGDVTRWSGSVGG